ncbi:non-ribosomal peptide synthetase [Pseudonocardia sp. TRM90224]|uniref:non-ribosomal peptide synthetase n=1 Tax=Pseudonocardia sp. TRM90224 TaxID=2812678 RepID=UPI001E5949C2|nr:non-ribosomal peptide synthetase [Pseudonocardia sp. TRM90224]
MSVAPAVAHPASPASAVQGGIWFNERFADLGAVHHMPFEVRFDGDLDVPALRKACEAVLTRHAVLRSAVEDRAGAPHLVPALVEPALVVEQGGDPRGHITAPFDLATGPLCRLVLQALGPRTHRLLVVAHHLVFDGQSTDLFVADLAAFYRAQVEGGEPQLPELPDGTSRAEEERIDAALPAARSYWAERPSVGPDVVLPALTGPVHGVQPGAAVQFRLPEPARERLGRTADRIGVSRFELVVASVHALLHRYGNTTPATALDLGTRGAADQHRIGVHVNELPFSTAPDGETPFAEFALTVRAALRELYRVRDVPLGRAGAAVPPGVALAPISLTYRRRIAPPRFPGVRAEVGWVLFNHTARGALRIHLVDGPDGLGVMLQYPTGAVAHDGAQSIAKHWLTLLDHIATAPDTTLAALPLHTREERNRLLVASNDTDVPYPATTLPELVAEQAARTPDAVAVVHGEQHLTYGVLDAAAGRFAARLRREGVNPGTIVGVRARRTERLLVGLLGILKAGAAYVPLDPDHPPERLAFIADDAQLAVQLSDADLADPGGGPVQLDPPPPDALAYVIYTSGSTGRPKGVQIEHRSLTNLLHAMRDLLGATAEHTWLAHTSLSFDISALELFLPLVTGGRVVVAGERPAHDGAALRELVERHDITHVQATPTGWAMLLDAGFDAPDVTALTGGEALTTALAARLRPRVQRLVNVYGPTETTIWSTADEVRDADDGVTIGRPIANTRTYVLDARLEPVPVGIPGDLYIAGAGLARGYLRRPELDRERFVPDPFREGRMYLTGDRVRLRGDGRMEFLGRLDDQVKLRGHRIELAEVEARLLAVPGVTRAAAAVRDGRLVAYHVGPADPGHLRRALAAALPAYLVPDAFVGLAELPTTPNGKLDRAALPAAATPEVDVPAAAGELEAVREIWCEVLDLPTIGDTEDLFDLGGHSITMTRISARIRDRLGVDVPLYAYFDEPTVRGIAAVVADLTGSGA